MSNVPLLVDHASIAKGSADMRDAVERARAKLAQIRGDVAASAGFWSGPAAGQFAALMAEYDMKANKLQAALDTIANLVDKSSANHAANEEQQGRAMNSLTGALLGQ